MFRSANLIIKTILLHTRKVVFGFGGLPRAYLRPEQTQNTELISLSMEGAFNFIKRPNNF